MQAAGATVRVHDATAATLAGDGAQLGLSPLGDETPWLRAAGYAGEGSERGVRQSCCPTVLVNAGLLNVIIACTDQIC